MKNEMKLIFTSQSANEALARLTVSAFASQLNPTLEELADIKTAVSEAVTNAIVHGYEDTQGDVEMTCSYENNVFTVIIADKGKGIQNIDKALQPFYTSHPEMERSGMGFTVMQTFMDDMTVETHVGEGTIVTMRKALERHE